MMLNNAVSSLPDQTFQKSAFTITLAHKYSFPLLLFFWEFKLNGASFESAKSESQKKIQQLEEKLVWPKSSRAVQLTTDVT